jgi:bacterioferritin
MAIPPPGCGSVAHIEDAFALEVNYVRRRTDRTRDRGQHQPPHTGIDMKSTMALTDVKTLRARARKHIEKGAVTEGYSADRSEVLRLLNEALATEIVCVLRYRRHHFMARGIDSKSTADEFLVHSNEEQGHADQIAERIVQLGGEPDFSPDSLTGRSHAEYVAGRSLVQMIKEDLVAERIAIDSYREMIQYLGDQDPTTSQMLKGILAVEEEHADELSDLLQGLPERKKS